MEVKNQSRWSLPGDKMEKSLESIGHCKKQITREI